MLFDTPIYLTFLVAVVVLYWRLRRAGQNRLLLAASYLFYGWWDWRFLLLMVLSTVVDYNLGRKIAASEDQRRLRALLTVSLVMNFGFLAFFKYFNFFLDSTVHALTLLGAHHISIPLLKILLPPGISFYTFQEVAYMVDVYHRKQRPARSFTDYALFISLFPHLIAGPIQRPSHLLPQVENDRDFNGRKFFDGCMLILTGLFRKCVIADNCAVLANAAFDGRLGSSAFSTLLGVLAFGVQIYGDFSGYSDLARGSAQLLGFHFMVNFRQPYLAETLQDFWRRWHISLSTWLRDYLYIPLGGSRRGESRTYLNLLLTMLLGGLWHGANWTFVIWGGIHGGFLALERLWNRGQQVRPASLGGRIVSRVFVLGVVGLSWVFFRATNTADAFRHLAALRNFQWQPGLQPAFIFIAAIIAVMMVLDLRLEFYDEEYPFERSRLTVPIAAAASLSLAIALFGATGSNAFIYFQF
jgi:D-alanyl-lipoteichoic acid acyltransferase DltB (MBOAT superfamily)